MKQPMKQKETVKVVGVQYSDYQQAKKPFKAGMKCELYHDATNPVDSNAVAVVCNGVRIGYLASGSAQQKAALREEIKSVTLKTHNPTNPTWHMFNVEITYKSVAPVIGKRLA